MKLNKYFDRDEFSCKCSCGFATVDVELLEVLTDVREFFDAPIVITSGCRCYEHNISVGGSKNSKHVQGIASDFYVKGIHEDTVADYLETKYNNKYGIGRYDGRTHIDTRSTPARWDER